MNPSSVRPLRTLHLSLSHARDAPVSASASQDPLFRPRSASSATFVNVQRRVVACAVRSPSQEARVRTESYTAVTEVGVESLLQSRPSD